MIDIQPIREENKLSQVIDAMKKADDGVDSPTHAIFKDNKIIQINLSPLLFENGGLHCCTYNFIFNE